MSHLAKNVLLAQAGNPIAAATTNANGSWVDCANFEGCLFLGSIGAATTSATIKVQYGASTTASGTDVTGASVSVAGTDDNKAFGIDVYAPHNNAGRYLRGVIVPSTAAGTLDFSGFISLRYDGRVGPKSSTSVVDAAIALAVIQTT